MIFLLCDPGWCVHKSGVQNKWDNNTHTHTHTHTHTLALASTRRPHSQGPRGKKELTESGAGLESGVGTETVTGTWTVMGTGTERERERGWK